MTTPKSDGAQTFIPQAGRTQLTAIIPDRAEARHAINDLRAFGLRLDQIRISMRDSVQQDRLMADTGLRASDGAVSCGAKVNPKGGLRGFMAGLRSNLLPNHPALGAMADGARVTVMPDGLIGIRMPEAEAQGIMRRHGGVLVNRLKWPTAD